MHRASLTPTPHRRRSPPHVAELLLLRTQPPPPCAPPQRVRIGYGSSPSPPSPTTNPPPLAPPFLRDSFGCGSSAELGSAEDSTSLIPPRYPELEGKDTPPLVTIFAALRRLSSGRVTSPTSLAATRASSSTAPPLLNPPPLSTLSHCSLSENFERGSIRPLSSRRRLLPLSSSQSPWPSPHLPQPLDRLLSAFLKHSPLTSLERRRREVNGSLCSRVQLDYEPDPL